MKSKSRNQSGNVLFIILIAVSLFAALSYAVSGMMRGPSTIGEERDGVLATEVMSYARSVRETISTLRITNGCEDTDISFERAPFDGSDVLFVNAGAPADFSCHVFHPDGGGISPLIPLDEISAFEQFYVGRLAISDIGNNSEPELTMLLRDLTLSQCTVLNKRLGLAAPQDDPILDINSIILFNGVYLLLDGIGSKIPGGGDVMYDAKPAGCFRETNITSGEYIYYHVLIAR